MRNVAGENSTFLPRQPSAWRKRHANPAQIIPDDVPDLVERMNEMNRSGRVDMDAYAGEPQMDDEDDAFGVTEDDE